MPDWTRLPSLTARRPRAHTVRIVDLPRGRAIAVDALPGDIVHVMHGAVWLTEPGRVEDVFAGSGERVKLARGGRVVVEALEGSRTVVPSRPDRLARTRLSEQRQ